MSEAPKNMLAAMPEGASVVRHATGETWNDGGRWHELIFRRSDGTAGIVRMESDYRPDDLTVRNFYMPPDEIADLRAQLAAAVARAERAEAFIAGLNIDEIVAERTEELRAEIERADDRAERAEAELAQTNAILDRVSIRLWPEGEVEFVTLDQLFYDAVPEWVGSDMPLCKAQAFMEMRAERDALAAALRTMNVDPMKENEK